MVMASSVLPSGTGRSAVAPPRMGLPNQPVFDGSWTPVPPEPVSNSSLRVQTNSCAQTPATANSKDMDSPPGNVDGQISYESELPSTGGCDCGSGACPDCSGAGLPVVGNNLLQRHGIVHGNGPLNRIRGRIGGLLGGGTRYGMCGFCPDASRYVVADGLYWSRSDGGVVGNNFGGVGGTDVWSGGLRITVGARRDAVSGVEATFMGLSSITDSLTSTSGAGNINANFTTSGGFNSVQTGSFYNATQTYQETNTQLYSIALNRVRYSWDVARTHCGIRYLSLQDDYLYSSTSAAGTGTYTLNAMNNMFGPEAGLDLYYDVGRRVSFSGFGKAGGYLNFTQIDSDLINNGFQFLNNRNTDVDLAASLELGINAHLHLTNHTRLRVGYNGMWLWGVASYDDNFPTTMSPTTGFGTDNSSSTFLHGANFGLEIYR